MLHWRKPRELSYSDIKDKLFLAYQPGYALVVCDWTTGEGWKDIKTNKCVDPEFVAVINLPDSKSENKELTPDEELIARTE